MFELGMMGKVGSSSVPSLSRDEFCRLVETHQAAVYAVAYSTLGNRAASEEIAQEAFLLAWKKYPELSEAPKLPAWFCGIARNLARNARRRHGAPLGEDALEHVPAMTTGPLDQLIDAENEATVSRALEALPDTYREPLVLYYGCDQSIRCVASALDISETAAKQRLRRGRELLEASVHEIVTRSLRRAGPGAAFTAAVAAALMAAPAPAHAATPNQRSPQRPFSTLAKLAIVSGGAAALIALGSVSMHRNSAPNALSSAESTTASASAQGSDDRHAKAQTKRPWLGPGDLSHVPSRHTRTPAVDAAAEGEVVSVELAQRLKTKVDLDLKDASLRDVLRLLSEVAGVPIISRRHNDSDVSLKLQATTVLDALDQVLEQDDSVWRQTEAVHVIADEKGPTSTLDGTNITLELAAVPFSQVIDQFSDILDMPIATDPSLAGPPITARFVNQPAGAAFNAVLRQGGFSYRIEDAIEVRPEDEATDEDSSD